ncbi:Protein of unknown function YceH [hydrothermal vent metagenome]|uniref:Uncharacterized protein n=1 Tax=hydrothermal vent metagenome TaxID=652676 RepID=A0A3B1CJ35_9ZZZZ
MMEITLSETEIRVLGALMEKELTTPDYYPLSLNALKNACNQTTNRNPLVIYDDSIIHAALENLIEKGLAWDAHLGRVAKYGENITEKFKLVPREIIVLALLFLRGAQTVGELRGRSERVYHFENLAAVHEVLEDLESLAWVHMLPRQAGRKESRYMHLFSDTTEVKTEDAAAQTKMMRSPSVLQEDKLKKMETELTALREAFEELKKNFLDFKAQF